MTPDSPRLAPLVRGILLPLALVTLAGAGASAPASSDHRAAAEAGDGPRAAGQEALGQRPRVDAGRLLADQATLAHDSMEGRRTGTPGNERARRFLLGAFQERGLLPLDGVWTQPFEFMHRQDGATYEGVNVLGVVPGSVHPERFVVVTAHYDHLGIIDGEIYNGADDNASGTSALLALGAWFRENRPRHSLLFVAFDAEEMGLQGARAFISDPPVPLDRIVMNVNLDMVSRSEAGELYAAGTYHYPFLGPLIEEAADRSGIQLRTGHDRPDLPPGDDWTLASDHGPFHQAGIPFIYFGVEDHAGYHQPTDVVDHVTPEFYVEAVETILDFLLLADRRGERILEQRGRGG